MNEVKKLREELEKEKQNFCKMHISVYRKLDKIIEIENKLIALGWLKPEEMTV